MIAARMSFDRVRLRDERRVGRVGQHARPTAVASRGRRPARLRPRRRSTASTSCRTVKIVDRTSGATRRPWRVSSIVSNSTRSIESSPRSSSRLASGGTSVRPRCAAIAAVSAARAASASQARSSAVAGRSARGRVRELPRQPLDLAPAQLARRGPRQRLERDVVAQDALVRRQLDRQALELEAHELAEVHDARVRA